MKDYIIFLLMIRLPQGTAITIFGIGSRPLTKDTVLTIENTQLINLLQSSGHPGILRDNTLRMPRDIL